MTPQAGRLFPGMCRHAVSGLQGPEQALARAAMVQCDVTNQCAFLGVSTIKDGPNPVLQCLFPILQNESRL